jgi:pimeloyl-ACP methyl ester carboxylesterase
VEEPLGRFVAQVERPEPIKFAWPVVLLGDIFTTVRHLGVLQGYLATIGWEVYAPDLRRSKGPADSFEEMVALAGEALDALGREAIVIGHGMGGLVALRMSERAGLGARIARWRGGMLQAPAGRLGFEMAAAADPHMREAIVREMVPDSARIALEIASGQVRISRQARATPRLVIAGERDRFAPADLASRLAHSIGAAYARVEGRGHWLIGGRALERAIAETQRFLVRQLGQELLLLYPEEFRGAGDDDE